MADQIHVAGKTTVKVQLTNTVGNLLTLGESIDMVDIEYRQFWHNVPGDRHGGPQGPPIDVQWLGAIYIVSVEFSRWDATTYDLLAKHGVMATEGEILLSECGTLILSNGNAFRLLLESTARPYNFPAAFIRDGISFNKGTKYTGLQMRFECHRCQDGSNRDGVLKDVDIAEYTS